MISPDGYISIYVDCTLNNLIYLKFHIERQLTMKFSDIDKKTQYVVSFISDNPDIYNIFTVYNNNIKLNATEFYSKQQELLKCVDVVLLVLCEHCWINDVIDTEFSSYNIYHCSTCNIRRRVW